MSRAVSEVVDKPASAWDELEIKNHFQKVAQSAQFERSENLRKLLLYLWEHRDKEVSEYAVGIEALGRHRDFDPKNDASVRVQIARLRQKLDEYYKTEGAEKTFTLHIPKGTHVLAVERQTSPPFLPPLAVPEPAAISLAAMRELLLGLLCGALLILSSWLLWDRYETRKTAQRPIVAPSSFWSAFIGTGTPIRIILPTPVFLHYPNFPKLRIRDLDVNDFDAWKSSDIIRFLATTGGNPVLEPVYTTTSDTLAAIDLARYLDATGAADRVTFGFTSDSSMDVLEKSSVVAFGSYSSLYQFRDYLASMNFSLAVNEAWVDNAHPAAGELQRYAVSSRGSGREIEFAIVAVLPGRRPNVKLIIMQSRHTTALVSMLTSQVGNTMFDKLYVHHGRPVYFEMVVAIEAVGDHIIRSWPVALHPYTKRAPTGADVVR